MFQRLIRFSLDNAGLVLGVALLILGVAAYRTPRMPVDVFPELNAPTVVIMAEAGGLAADEVEQYVVFPVESAINGMPGLRRVRSASALSLGIIWAEFDWGEDIYRARQFVSERLAGVEEDLPEGTHLEITPVTSITGEIMILSLSSPDGKATPMELRDFAEFDLRNRLLSVPGISQVVALGGELPEYQINVRQDRLVLYELSLEDVVEAASAAHSVASAGYLPDVGGREIPLRQRASVRDIEDIAQALVSYHNGAPVTLGDVADVTFAGAPKRGTAADKGFPAVAIAIQKAPGTNTLALTERIDHALDEVEKILPEGMVLNRHVVRQSDFIELSVDNLIHVLRDAGILVAIVLILFLMNLRTTIITLLALPLSLAIALLILEWMGLTINVMTLGGLAVAIGELVDDAIIDVENVFRRLRENAERPPEERLAQEEVVFRGSNEIRSSVVFATFIIMLAFAPPLFFQGLEGRFFRPLGFAYIISIFASLLVALTVTPALCKLLLRGNLGHEKGEGAVVRGFKRLYRPFLNAALRWRKTVLSCAALATAASLALASTFGASFLPEFNEGSFTVFLLAPPGTSLQASDRLARGVEKRLAAIEGVRSVVRRTGRAERDEHAEPVSSSEIDVSVKPGYRKNAIRRAIEDVLSDVPGITTMIGQPIEHRLSHVLSGTPAALAINIYGEDLATLRILAKEVEAALKQIPSAAEVNAQREVTVESLPIDYRPRDLAAAGLAPSDAARQLEIAFNGVTVAEINQGIRRHSLTVRLRPEDRERVEQVKDFILEGRGGARVRLSQVANIGPERSSNLIARENGRRKAVVSCNVAEGHNLSHLVAAARQKVDPIVHARGYSVEYGGQFEAQQAASQTLLVLGSAAIGAIFLLLLSALGSVRAALLVLVNLPLGLIGGVAAIYIAESADPIGNFRALLGLGGEYQAPVASIASLVGFVTLFGIAVRNGILLVNHIQDLETLESKPRFQAVVQGSMERLIPILMTALTAILGLLPLALAAGEPGSELLAPLAIVALGGLITSTFLNLIVVPAGYLAVFGTGEGRPESKTLERAHDFLPEEEGVGEASL